MFTDHPAETPTDSARISHGTFRFSGLADNPRVGRLALAHPQAGDPIFLHSQPVVLEPGRIQFLYEPEGVAVSGSPINERYNRLILQPERALRARNREIVRQRDSLYGDRPMTRLESEPFNQRIEALYRELIPYHVQFVRENIGNAVGEYFFFRYPPDRYEQHEWQELFGALRPEIRERYLAREAEKERSRTYFQESQKRMVPG